jgi:hypothetical protein
MKLRTFVVVLLTSAMAGAASTQVAQGPGAQPAQKPASDLYCVYDTLTNDKADAFYNVVIAYLGGGSEADAKAAESLVNEVASACAQAHAWNQLRKDIASAVAVQTGVVDVVSGELTQAGLKLEALESINTQIGRMPPADLKAFFTGAWRGDKAFQARIKGELKSLGVPDDPTLLDGTMQLIESSIIAGSAQADWARLPKQAS